jgi:hypothetical protein
MERGIKTVSADDMIDLLAGAEEVAGTFQEKSETGSFTQRKRGTREGPLVNLSAFRFFKT